MQRKNEGVIYILNLNRKSNKINALINNEKGIELIQKMGLIAVGLALVGVISTYMYNTSDARFGQIENSAATIYDEIDPNLDANGNSSVDVGQIQIIAFNTQRLGGYEADHYASAEETIQNYTHTKSGTTHSLTGTGKNVNFIATGNWTAGDTLLFNGSNACFCDVYGNKLDTDNLFISGAFVRNIYPEYDSGSGMYKCYLTVFPK